MFVANKFLSLSLSLSQIHILKDFIVSSVFTFASVAIVFLYSQWFRDSCSQRFANGWQEGGRDRSSPVQSRGKATFSGGFAPRSWRQLWLYALPKITCFVSSGTLSIYSAITETQEKYEKKLPVITGGHAPCPLWLRRWL